jgi:glycosyltransferase involved in cell wall biosynthesis
MRPVSILYIHNSAQIAGGNRALLGLFDYLNRDRFRAVSVLPASGPMEQELRVRGVPHFVMPIEATLTRGRLQALQLVWRLGRVFIRERIRLLHANDGLCYRHASIASRLFGIHRICHLQFPPDHGGLAWALEVRPDVLITCSKHMGRQLRDAQLACLQSVPIVPVENAVDTLRYRPPEDLEQLRRSLAIDGSSHIVTIVGSVSERKGHRDFLDGAKRILERRPLTLFLVLGDDLEGKGAYRVAMQDYARSLGIASRVRFLGFRADTVDWVAASDVIVLPSLQEGLPLSLAEAHGCGKPVVATRVDGIPEIVEDGVSGFLFEPHDVAGMCAALTRLLEDEPLRLEMGAAGRQRAERIFSQRTHAAKVQEVYERLLGGTVGGPSFRRPHSSLIRLA